MKNNKLTKLSSEQLEAKKKIITGSTIGLGTVLIITCFILFYLAINDENYMLIPIAIGLLLTLIPGFVNLSQISSEIKSRKSKYV